MFGTQDLGLFAVTVLVVNATPGVDLMLTLTRTLQRGVRAGLWRRSGSRRWRRALQAASGLLFAGLAARLGWVGRS